MISGNGDGTFTDPKKPTYTLDTEYIISMGAADRNRDGRSDFVVSLLPVSNPERLLRGLGGCDYPASVRALHQGRRR